MEEISILKKLGFTEYEARAYSSLAKLGASTVKEIVLESKLPRNKAYESLQRLEMKNKIVSLPISPRKYKIISLESLKEEVGELNTAVDYFIKLMKNPKKISCKDLFWVIKGKRAIEEQLRVNNPKVKKEILACNNLSKVLYGNLRVIKERIKQGVKVKMICTFDKNKISIYKEWLGAGVQLRIFNHSLFGPILPRISIFDSSVARLTIGKPEVQREEDYITLWTESKAFALMLKNHFINMWKNSEPIEKYLTSKKLR